MKKQTYVLGFISHEGVAGRLFRDAIKIPKPERNSFENWISKEYDFAFVDFKKFNLLNPGVEQSFYMSGAAQNNSQPHKNYQAPYSRIFDGVFFSGRCTGAGR